MKTPVTTYRIQVRPSFDLDAVAGLMDYLHDLGADCVYLSPLLEAEVVQVVHEACDRVEVERGTHLDAVGGHGRVHG